tara:strand:- start:789 stop:1646 length:858 start_codon:yes stop_codon:yes gene_type:complete
MDIVSSDAGQRARAYHNLRAQFVKEHNHNVRFERAQVAKDLLQVEGEKRDELAESREKGAIDEVQQGIGAFIDAGAAARAGKSMGQKKADALAKSLTGKTTAELSDALTTQAGKKGRSILEREGAKITESSLAKTGAEVGSDSMIRGALKGGGKVALRNAGGLFNIGLGAEAMAEDFKGGHLHLAGKNGLEEASNVLQIGSGIADVAAFAFPPAAALGALLGVASSVAEGLGKREEEQDTESKIRSRASKAKGELEESKKNIGDILKAPPSATEMGQKIIAEVAA